MILLGSPNINMEVLSFYPNFSEMISKDRKASLHMQTQTTETNMAALS